MNTDERALIDELYDRMRTLADAPRDGEAEAVIAGHVRHMPFAPYLLTQTVLVQDHALRAANARIEELEAELRAKPAQASTGSSFLGGLLGGAPARATSVPAAGARPAQGGYDYPGREGVGQPQPAGQPPVSRFGGGGGFLQGALATAAGVAGGALLFDGIKSMMGGSPAEAKTADAGESKAGDTAGNDSFFSNPWGDSTKPEADTTASADQPDPFPYEENYAADDSADDDGFFGGDSDDSGWA